MSHVNMNEQQKGAGMNTCRFGTTIMLTPFIEVVLAGRGGGGGRILWVVCEIKKTATSQSTRAPTNGVSGFAVQTKCKI